MREKGSQDDSQLESKCVSEREFESRSGKQSFSESNRESASKLGSHPVRKDGEIRNKQ